MIFLHAGVTGTTVDHSHLTELCRNLFRDTGGLTRQTAGRAP